MIRQAKVVGSCYVCLGPVFPYQVARVADPSTLTRGRITRRLVHRGACEEDLRTRIGRGGRS